MSSQMQNEDFRVFLNNFSEEKEKVEQEEKKEPAERKQRKKEKEKEKEIEIEKDVEKNKEKEKPKYRNRAEERRKGIVKDIEDETVLYNNKNNTIDESKFMGGDIEHTHLVKGLDFVLLQKVRADLNQLKEGQSSFITFGERKEGEKDKYLSESQNNNVECKQIYKYFFLHEHPHHKDFRNKVKNISDSIIEKNMKFRNYNKSVHNTFYKCNLHMELELNDIPPKYIVENEEIQRITTNYLGTDYLNEIGDCFKWHSINKKRKKEDRLMKRKSRFLQNETIEEDSADIDMFAKDDNEVNDNIDNNNCRVKQDQDSSEDSDISDNSSIDSYNKKRKVDNDRKISLDQVQTTPKTFGSLQHNTKFDLTNTAEKEDEKNAFGNAFKDTYDECYPH